MHKPNCQYTSCSKSINKQTDNTKGRLFILDTLSMCCWIPFAAIKTDAAYEPRLTLQRGKHCLAAVGRMCTSPTDTIMPTLWIGRAQVRFRKLNRRCSAVVWPRCVSAFMEIQCFFVLFCFVYACLPTKNRYQKHLWAMHTSMSKKFLSVSLHTHLPIKSCVLHAC